MEVKRKATTFREKNGNGKGTSLQLKPVPFQIQEFGTVNKLEQEASTFGTASKFTNDSTFSNLEKEKSHFGKTKPLMQLDQQVIKLFLGF